MSSLRLMVTGAGGMLGQAVQRAAAQAGHDVHAFTRAQLDIADADAVNRATGDAGPQAVVNLAAWTDVDGAEADPQGAHAINADGAGNVARAAARHGARLVHVSTDYVFDGTADRPYVESDPTGPRSQYGATKLAGEQQVAGENPNAAIVRTAWLFGAGGRNFVDTMLRLAGEGSTEVSVVDDQRGCPTWTGHLAPALLQVALTEAKGIMHVAGGGSCTWYDLAREVFRQANLEVHVQPVTSEQMKRPAPRPHNSVLRTERDDAPCLPPWQEGVRGHLAAIGGPPAAAQAPPSQAAVPGAAR